MEAEWALPGFMRKLEETTHFLPGREGEGWLLRGVGRQGQAAETGGTWEPSLGLQAPGKSLGGSCVATRRVCRRHEPGWTGRVRG